MRLIHIDDCFRYAGDLVDNDMRKGDFADAKGKGYARAFRSSFQREQGVMADMLENAEKQTRAVAAVGHRIKWYFAEKEAADIVRDRFNREPFAPDIVIGYMRPRKERR